MVSELYVGEGGCRCEFQDGIVVRQDGVVVSSQRGWWQVASEVSTSTTRDKIKRRSYVYLLT